MDWQTRTVKHPDVFQKGEQGLFNYVALRRVHQGTLTIRRVPFMVWPGEASRAQHIHLEDLTPNSPHPQVIHWARLGWGKTIAEIPRSEILLHFEKIYYLSIPLGARLRQWRRAQFLLQRSLIAPLKLAAKKFLSKLI